MKFYSLLSIIVLPAVSAIGSVTLDISLGDLQNSSGVATNGMQYAIVVDTSASGNGFEVGSYIGFDITTNGQFLYTANGVTDDWFVYGGSLGTGQTPPTTSNIFPYGDGAIGIEADIDFTNLSQGDEFAVIWFPGGSATSSGDEYGFFTDTGSTLNMVIPADGQDSTPPSSVSTKSVDFQVVPEPSAFGFVGLFCFVWLMFRRRSVI